MTEKKLKEKEKENKKENKKVNKKVNEKDNKIRLVLGKRERERERGILHTHALRVCEIGRHYSPPTGNPVGDRPYH